jgi:hypothetical protein
MSFRKVFFSFLISIAVTSCAFVPSSSPDQPYYYECDMVTKKLTLETTQMGQLGDCDDGGIAECIIMTGILSTASLIVSGSIVLLGNTLHWSEYKLSC